MGFLIELAAIHAHCIYQQVYDFCGVRCFHVMIHFLLSSRDPKEKMVNLALMESLDLRYVVEY